MRKLLPWITLLILMSLAACSLPARTTPVSQDNAAATPTLSADEMQTQISQMLTLMPTVTGQPQGDSTATPGLPTVAVETAAPEGEGAAGVIVTVTPMPTATALSASPTPEPTEEPAAAQVATATTAPQATATATIPAGPTFTPAPDDPRGRLGNPTSTDNMDDPFTWVWPTGRDKYTRGVFRSGTQTVIALTDTDGWRLANPQDRPFGNMYLETTFRLGACSGSDHYGVIARVPDLPEPDQGYLFVFSCDGRYSVRRWDGEEGVKGKMNWLVNWTASSAIAAGSNQVNRMGVWMIGPRLVLYANGKLLTEVRDNTHSTGYFGVMVGSDQTPDLSIQVDQMAYWENPTVQP